MKTILLSENLTAVIVLAAILFAVIVLNRVLPKKKRKDLPPLDWAHYVPGEKLQISGLSYGEAPVVGPFYGQLVPEPTNPHDPDAVLVLTLDGHRIGYLPKGSGKYAAAIADEQGGRSFCFGVIMEGVDEGDGRRYRYGHLWAHAYLVNSHGK